MSRLLADRDENENLRTDLAAMTERAAKWEKAADENLAALDKAHAEACRLTERAERAEAERNEALVERNEALHKAEVYYTSSAAYAARVHELASLCAQVKVECDKAIEAQQTAEENFQTCDACRIDAENRYAEATREVMSLKVRLERVADVIRRSDLTHLQVMRLLHALQDALKG